MYSRPFPRACALLGLLLCAAARAAADDSSSAILHILQARLPDIKMLDLKSSAVPGLFEVFTGERIFYTDANGDFILAGKLIDTRTRRDLTAERLDSRLRVDFSKLPFDDAIMIVKGKGERKLAVFEDPDCPYCQKFESEFSGIDNVTLYVFLYPITELHPGARARAHAIWCAPERTRAWTQWMAEHREPGGARDCTDPLDELQALGNTLHVTGTPTLFLQNGRRLQGALPAAELQALLEPHAAADTRNKKAAQAQDDAASASRE